jgi:Resolvase, N terminal domain/SAM domain (Sterile alpha motif)
MDLRAWLRTLGLEQYGPAFRENKVGVDLLPSLTAEDLKDLGIVLVDRALSTLQRGDTLTVWKLDRLGRSLPHLVETIASLRERGIQFRSLTDPIDTSSAAGELIFHVFCALAQFERAIIRERINAGIQAAKARGIHVGRRYSLTTSQVEHAKRLRDFLVVSTQRWREPPPLDAGALEAAARIVATFNRGLPVFQVAAPQTIAAADAAAVTLWARSWEHCLLERA